MNNIDHIGEYEMKYPLPEIIGNPDLFTGRKKEFDLLDKWLSRIPDRLAESLAILSRRKSGKTAIVQRIFNRLWSQNGQVIPFYINVQERNIWLADFTANFFQIFTSQFISFLERDEFLADNPLKLEQIRDYGLAKGLSHMADDADYIIKNYEKKTAVSLMWNVASSAPKRYARLYDRRFLVIIDEFQNTGEYIYVDENQQYVDKTIPGTWHDLSESKLAPMLVTGSYIGLLINIINKYLEAGRLKQVCINPYLTTDDGLQAVYKYAEFYREPITNESAVQINRLCMSDPFFINCVLRSFYKDKNLATGEGVVNTVHYEITDRKSQMSLTWGEYIELSLKRINNINSKQILLHLSRHPEQEWTHQDLKDELNLDIDKNYILELLDIMVQADLIQEGSSDIRYKGLTDGTLNLILRSRFEEEIESHQPDLKRNFHEELQKLRDDKKSLEGLVRNLTGKMAEYQLMTEFRSRKRFSLSRYFENVTDDTKLNIIDTKLRTIIQRPDGKNMELDILAKSDCGRILAVEVKKTADPVGTTLVQDFREKVNAFAGLNPDSQIIPAYFSTGGFSEEAHKFCKKNGIATAREINF